jgi:hypothetical protein
MGAEVDYVVTKAPQFGDHRIVQRDSGVVGSDGDPHSHKL